MNKKHKVKQTKKTQFAPLYDRAMDSANVPVFV